MESRPYLILAILLSEIGLSSGIVAESDGTKLVCLIYKTDRAPGQKLSRAELLVRVAAASSREYCNAIKCCLHCDNLAQGNSAHDLRLFAERVMMPVHSHSVLLRQHATEQHSFYEESKRLCKEGLNIICTHGTTGQEHKVITRTHSSAAPAGVLNMGHQSWDCGSQSQSIGGIS